MGAMDLFPLHVGTAGPPPSGGGITSTTGLNMGYFDGNTVTALWNYAQHFAMSDNSYSTTFGPSTPGMLSLISGQNNGVKAHLNGTGDEVDGGAGSLTVIGDPDPIGDVCSNPTRNQVQMAGRNIGDAFVGLRWVSSSETMYIGIIMRHRQKPVLQSWLADHVAIGTPNHVV